MEVQTFHDEESLAVLRLIGTMSLPGVPLRTILGEWCIEPRLDPGRLGELLERLLEQGYIRPSDTCDGYLVLTEDGDNLLEQSVPHVTPSATVFLHDYYA